MPLIPKFTVSGYRGVWKDTLTEDITRKYVRAFARFLKEDLKKDSPTLLIGRDGRESGPEIKSVVLDELVKNGINYVDGEVLPTPTVLFSVRKHKYDGAIIVTASHNPIEYNGLKFVNDQALFLEKEQAKKINEYCQEEQTNIVAENPVRRNNITSDNADIPDFPKEHADAILASVDVELIRKKNFKVAVDMINASACVIDPYLFAELGVELIPLNNIPNGKFAHRPEPNTETLVETARMVQESGADLGFAHDPDADRLVVLDESGVVTSEEYTIAFAIKNVLDKNPGESIVINLSTSKMSKDYAEAHGSKCFMTEVGEPNVVREIINQRAIIGGEGNGGVIYPLVNLCRDSFMGIALILELLAREDKSVSQMKEEFTKYYMKKGKWPIKAGLEAVYERLRQKFPEAKTIDIDGIYLSFPDSAWIHLHPSNTEPIFRLFGEAKTPERIEQLFKEAELTFE